MLRAALSLRVPRRAWLVGLLAGAAGLLSACSGISLGDMFNSGSPPPPQAGAVPPQAAGASIGDGQVKIGLILPLSATGNAGLAAQSMKNAAEMALAEFNSPNVQLLVKDDGGNPQGAQLAAQQAIDEGAELILGPLFAQSVGAAAQPARARGVPIIAFSTDANVAARGVYLLSFLPESDVDRMVDYAVANGKSSFAALLPDSAYGSVVEAAFKQALARKNARIVALERYPPDKLKMQDPVKIVAQAASRADAIYIPDGGDVTPLVVQSLAANGVTSKRIQFMGSTLWGDDPRIPAEAGLQGAWYPAPNAEGFRSFANRYRARYGQDPVRTATLSYDAVALVAALVKTQGPQRFSEEVLTNPSGFAGIDGIFRFKTDGTNARGLAVLRVTPTGGQIVSPAPRAFGGSGI